MGNSAGRESRTERDRSVRSASLSHAYDSASNDRLARSLYGHRGDGHSRPDISSFLHFGPSQNHDDASPLVDGRRETRPEREARKAEKEKANRELERQSSLQHESVDGGYLVTLGVYTGPEDYSKPVVRQLQVSLM